MSQAEVSLRYQTLMWSLLVMAAATVGYSGTPLLTQYQNDSAMYGACITVIIVLFFLSIGVGLAGSLGHIGYGVTRGTDAVPFARKALPGVVSTVLILDGLLISISGGATHSPFTHFLGATCAITLIFAEKDLTVTGIVYIATMWLYFPEGTLPVPRDDAERTVRLQNAIIVGRYANGAHFVCFAISVVMAAFAAWRLQLPGEPIELADPANRLSDSTQSK